MIWSNRNHTYQSSLLFLMFFLTQKLLQREAVVNGCQEILTSNTDLKKYSSQYNPKSQSLLNLVQHNNPILSKKNQIYKPVGGLFLNGSQTGLSFWKQFRFKGFNLKQNKYQLPEFTQNLPEYIYLLFVVQDEEDLMASLSEAWYNINVSISSLNRTSLVAGVLFTLRLERNMKPDLGKIRFTNNSKYLFLKVGKNDQDFGAVAIMSIQYPRITYIDDGVMSRYKSKAFDLQKCPTKNLFDVMPHTGPVPKRVLYHRKTNSCNLAYFLAPRNNIYILQDCQPYKPPIKLTIRLNGTYENIFDMPISTNKKCFILLINVTTLEYPYPCNLKFDVRLIEDLQRSVHETQAFLGFMIKIYSLTQMLMIEVRYCTLTNKVCFWKRQGSKLKINREKLLNITLSRAMIKIKLDKFLTQFI